MTSEKKILELKEQLSAANTVMDGMIKSFEVSILSLVNENFLKDVTKVQISISAFTINFSFFMKANVEKERLHEINVVYDINFGKNKDLNLYSDFDIADSCRLGSFGTTFNIKNDYNYVCYYNNISKIANSLSSFIDDNGFAKVIVSAIRTLYIGENQLISPIKHKIYEIEAEIMKKIKKEFSENLKSGVVFVHKNENENSVLKKIFVLSATSKKVVYRDFEGGEKRTNPDAFINSFFRTHVLEIPNN